MVKRLPSQVVTYALMVFASLIPVLISLIATSDVFQNPEMNLTMLEHLDKENILSNLDIIVQNVGNSPATNIRVFLDSHSYQLKSFETTDAKPDISSYDEQLRVSIQRLSPQAYVILHTQGTIVQDSKTLWVTSDKITRIITLPPKDTSSGISSIDIKQDRNIILFVAGGLGILSLLALRYYNFYRSEYTRREYVGIYKINIVRYRSKYLTGGLLVLFATFSLSIIIDNLYEPFSISDYVKNQVFALSDDITEKIFLQINDPSNIKGSPGIITFFIGILISLFYSNRDIKLPSFIWSLKPDLSKVMIKDATSSFISTKEVSIHTTKNVDKLEAEILVVKENNEIIGLVSKKVAKDKSLKAIFNEKTSSKKRRQLNIDRKNFLVVKEEITLELLKKEMEDSKMLYAVIENSNKEFVGVINYDDLFGEPKILS